MDAVLGRGGVGWAGGRRVVGVVVWCPLCETARRTPRWRKNVVACISHVRARHHPASQNRLGIPLRCFYGVQHAGWETPYELVSFF